MSSGKAITIVGGGLAGLALGIGLRQRGVNVMIWEAGSYPRHRVCGEFISGNGQAFLNRLNLLEKCHQSGAVYAQTMRFFLGDKRSPIRQLTTPALCLSRHRLDALMAEAFQELDGDLRVNVRWNPGSEKEGLVHASGRQASGGEESNRWFGMKAHVPAQTPVKLEADLEMHVSSGGYIGVNRIDGGETNVCGLFRARKKAPSLETKEDRLRGDGGSVLRERLQDCRFDPKSFCSVGGLQLKPRRASDRSECCIGDTLTMTPPITGNGMSMAFESAELAMEPLTAYSGGRLTWKSAQQLIARRCDRAFYQRLAWARLLQRMMMAPALHGQLGLIFLRSNWLWQFLFARTRR